MTALGHAAADGPDSADEENHGTQLHPDSAASPNTIAGNPAHGIRRRRRERLDPILNTRTGD